MSDQPPIDTAVLAEVQTLQSRVTSRPADPVAQADLARALRPVDPEASALHAAKAQDLIVNCLRFGATAAARQAACQLAETFDSVDFHVLYAETLVHDGNLTQAVNVLSRLVHAAPRSQDAIRPRVALAALTITDDVQAALAWVEPIAEATRPSRGMYLQCLLAAGRPREAVEFGAKAIEANPEAAELHQFYGAALLESQAFEQATTAFAESLRLNPEAVGAHFNLSIALARQGALAGAVGVADAGLARDPQDRPLAQLRTDILGQLNR